MMEPGQDPMDVSTGGRRIASGAFGPSDDFKGGSSNEVNVTQLRSATDGGEDVNMIMEEKASMEDTLSENSQMFFDAQSSMREVNPNGTSIRASGRRANGSVNRRPSDIGSIPLKGYSLEIIDAVSPGGVKDKYDLTRHSSDGSGLYQRASQREPTTVVQVEEKNPDIDFLADDPADMTNGRRIALWMMKRFAWYNPNLNSNIDRNGGDFVLDEGRYRTQDGYPIKFTKEETPSLEKAWAYFDHVALPRYIFEEKENAEKKGLITRIIRKFSKANKQLDRAEPGEDDLPTRLYSPIFTPHKQLGDFGLGIGLYFSTVRALTLLALLAGCIHLPNIMYYASEEYSNGQPAVDSFLKGSAVCTDNEWVACPTCHHSQFSPESFLNYTDLNATFALKNRCVGTTITTGSSNYACLMFIVAASLVLNRYLHKMEVQFDEDEQTAQDYSIVITNPPEDATDPKEWQEYFKRAFDAHVTGCTVAVDNDLLVHTLRERREKMRMLELLVEPGTSLDIVTLAGIAAGVERSRNVFQSILSMVAPGIPEIFARMAVLTAKVQGLAQQDYPVTNVFITFETEAGQRRVLEKLTVGQSAIDSNRTSSVGDAKYLFRGFRVLSVFEPEEPDSIRWEDLNVTFFDRMKQQFFTALATVLALLLVAFLVRTVNDFSTAGTSMAIAVANAVFPMLAKALTYSESHPSHGSLQTSLYFKIAVFRWVTTAIIIALITPFEDTLMFGVNQGLVQQVYAQFIAEIVTATAIQLSDPVGHLQRHFLAPRATTQDAMNLLMQGTKFELAERYTAVAKLLFLTFWYCSLFPSSFFLCALALQVIYYLDKLSLTRTWKRVPKLGATISQFNRNYFLPLSILAMALLSSYYWAGFPFDNLCEDTGNQVPDFYVGTHSVGILEKETLANLAASLSGNREVIPLNIRENATVVIEPNATTYRYCNQNLLSSTDLYFPFVPYWQEFTGNFWMTEEQEQVTLIYGWTAAGFLIGFILLLIYNVLRLFLGYFYGSYEAVGDDQGENFSELESANIYIPQVESLLFSYPLLACCVDDIDEDMLDWTDPDHPHAFYDLTKDAQALIRGIDITDKVVFSQVAHWPPGKEAN